MTETQVSMGQMKRNLSRLVDQVATGAERIILTSRGEPKAVLVSLEDYDQIRDPGPSQDLDAWETWLAASDRLAIDIRQDWGAILPDIDAIWEEAKADLEARHDFLLDH